MSIDILKIGTRGSPLAITQTKMVQAALHAAHPDLHTDIVIIKTSGDWRPEDGEIRLKDEEGGKGQFAKEIEEQMLDGRIDIAVHSMKDMETRLPDGLVIDHMLPREDARDAFLVHDSLAGFKGDIAALPVGTVIGTASVRRQAFLLAQNPGLKIVPLRGNVQTRIEKLRAGQVQATLLAYAGLRRLDLANEADYVFETDSMLPAAGQGAVGIERRAADTAIKDLLDPISCRKTVSCTYAERAVLDLLDGSCHTPIGAHATLDNTGMTLRACIASLDGQAFHETEAQKTITTPEEASAFGTRLGQILKDKAPAALLSQRAQD